MLRNPVNKQRVGAAVNIKCKAYTRHAKSLRMNSSCMTLPTFFVPEAWQPPGLTPCMLCKVSGLRFMVCIGPRSSTKCRQLLVTWPCKLQSGRRRSNRLFPHTAMAFSPVAPGLTRQHKCIKLQPFTPTHQNLSLSLKVLLNPA